MPPTVLVVDDDPTIGTFLSRVLTRSGYQVRNASDGLAALAVIADARPALVLTDRMMPRMNGDELVARLMQRPDPIPCILMSAFDGPPPRDDVPVLSKPFPVATLLDLIAGTLAPRSARGEVAARPCPA